MSLPFQPACLPMLLGGLPQRSAAQALALARRHTGALLAWPQLPQRSPREQNLLQAALGFPGLQIDQQTGAALVDREAARAGLDRLALAYLTHDISYAALAEDDAAGLAELARQRDSLRGVLALKGQLLGPVSLALLLTDEQQRPLIYDAPYFEALTQHLHLRAAWQSACLAELGPATIVCVDEPFLDAVGMPFLPVSWDVAVLQINEVLAGISGCKAIYVGGMPNWERLLATSADMIVADVFHHGAALAEAAPALAEFLDHDGLVGLGLVPADEGELAGASAEGLIGRVEALLAQLAPHGITAQRLLPQALLSTSDSLGGASAEHAERALQLLAETSRGLRERYQLA